MSGGANGNVFPLQDNQRWADFWAKALVKVRSGTICLGPKAPINTRHGLKVSRAMIDKSPIGVKRNRS